MNDDERMYIKRAEDAEKKARDLESKISNFKREPLEKTPKNLVPRSGELPSSTVYYRTATILHDASEDSNAEDIDAPVEIAGMFGESWGGTKVGFEKPHKGVLVTHEQSWQVKGISLGNLLHSLTLAPGEATRVAIQDWGSVKRGESQEDTTQQERAASSDTQNRSLDEIQSAAAREALSGSSKNSANAVSASAGVSLLFFSAGASTSNSWATSVNTSRNKREAEVNESQRIQQATEQAAESARTRRASVVRETSQSDTTKTTTRIVANYNHMHALTMMYYEVLEVYSVTTKVKETTPCVFIPMQILTGEQLLAHYPLIMAKAAGIAGMDILETAIRAKTAQFYSSSNLPKYIRLVEEAYADVNRKALLWPVPDLIMDHLEETKDRPAFKGIADDHNKTLNNFARLFILAKLSLQKINILSPSNMENLSAAISALTEALGGVKGQENTISQIGGSYTYIGSDEYLPRFTEDGKKKIKAYSIDGIAKNNFVMVRVVRAIDKLNKAKDFVEGIETMQTEVGGMIDSFREYFNQAVWFEALTPTVVHTMFKNKKFDGHPLNTIIDPNPVAMTGNLIGFIRTDLDDQPETSDTHEKMVVIPTGGVFAEAVLGESVAAEQIDLSRFWNWQDSPIPLTPTEISPISTSHQATDMDLNAGNFADFQAKLRTLSALPNPAGLEAMLNAMSSGDMFKGMDGREVAKEMANMVAKYASEGAAKSQELASSNLQKGLDVGGRLAGQALETGGKIGTAAITGGASIITDGFKSSATVLGGLIKEQPGVVDKLLGTGVSKDSKKETPTPENKVTDEGK